jgi:uncharacterized protein YciI
MHFCIVCTDKPGRSALRTETRPAHLDYLKRFKDRLFAAGPFLDDSGNALGSLIVIDLASRKAAEEFVAHDPYTKAELFESVVIRAWKKVIPES